MAKTTSGTKIVLTASATEMSEFGNNPFVAFVEDLEADQYQNG
jgi:hypothetical protein